MSKLLAPNSDIRKAATLSAAIYRDPELYRAQVERIFARSWHCVGAVEAPSREGALPLTLLPGSLDEPIVLTRDRAGAAHCLSNVCTHRGNILVGAAGPCSTLRCRYHGRRFGLDGRFASMPEFEGADGFPSASDDLPRVPSARLGPLLFAGVRPVLSFDEWLGPMRARLGFVDWDRLTLVETRDYEVNAHWALYCDNYLEGFHVPFVHAGLAEALVYGDYTTETFPTGVLQVGVGKSAEEALELPANHPDAGRGVAALYAFLFPGTMLNVYRWGVSVNIVAPLGIDRTRITFLSLTPDGGPLPVGAGLNDLHRVEMEDEAVVESVQRGVRSRFYGGGRFSPRRETGVHHFQRLVAEAMNGSSEG